MVVAVISPNAEAEEVIAKALERTGRVDAVWSLPAYPDPSQLKDLPQDPAGCIVFLDCSDSRAATAIATAASGLSGAIQIVAMVPNRAAMPPDRLRRRPSSIFAWMGCVRNQLGIQYLS